MSDLDGNREAWEKEREDQQVASNEQRRAFQCGVGAGLEVERSLGPLFCSGVVVEPERRLRCHDYASQGVDASLCLLPLGYDAAIAFFLEREIR